MNACYEMLIIQGAEQLLNLVESKAFNRRYILEDRVHSRYTFDDGILDVLTEPGFMFDARSGTPLLDWFCPNLGTLAEREAWRAHDCLAYAQSLDFWHTNRALRLILRDQAGWNPKKAWLVEKGVSINRSWYGKPSPKDWCYSNIGKVSTVWVPKE